MKIIKNPKQSDWRTLTERPTQSFDAIQGTVKQVFNAIANEGDTAIQRYTEQFDGVQLSNLQVTNQEIEAGVAKVSEALKNAIIRAKENIYTFHQAQKTAVVRVETTNGVQCWQEKRPIDSVGLYIPGGTAPLFSTVLMLAVPANIAGCKEVILCTPPNGAGEINPAILFAAQLCGVTKIFKVGGIQAIAGLTFGTTSIPKVAKIFGPGNQYVTAAKQLATQYGIAIDMPAGPSELLVVGDESANAAFIASDLLSQAEHGIDSQVILVSTSANLIPEVMEALEVQLNALPRKEIAAQALENSKAIYFETKEEALAYINEYGPEHFIINTNNDDFYWQGVSNAGSVFIGSYTPESAGDYASGTNHTLPTNGYAKAYSGVNLDSYLKSITFQRITAEGIQNIGETIEIMAEAEGLQAHKNAVTLRLNSLKN